jgi:hypothetical protein
MRWAANQASVSLSVNDEFAVDVPNPKLAQAIAFIREVMYDTYPLRGKLEIDLAAGSNWGNGVAIKDIAAWGNCDQEHPRIGFEFGPFSLLNSQNWFKRLLTTP